MGELCSAAECQKATSRYRDNSPEGSPGHPCSQAAKERPSARRAIHPCPARCRMPDREGSAVAAQGQSPVERRSFMPMFRYSD
jgi:hypothetical protein